ncbi:hypothetical protein HXX76_011710 [Chlamydomonas incerta]|uniref:Uncharacterized protein n=1 Tax=Chlamydomonas incerta TaxID=51695 RepID=A0A835SJ28_CHLIN|nr:hypothetical protein HXX76_011710 [Chlamydomonas incerta]|eukprot:KAG2426481.1 hypothetical protein HXX76_011710 [Chlamydomonas incerta]
MLQLAVRQALKSRSSAPLGLRTAWSLTEALGLNKGKEPVDVYAIDPKLVLNPEKLKAADLDKVAARVTVCRELLPKLSRGESELAEMDEPGNAWYFGERAEIFDYKLVGEFSTKSGFAALVHADVVERLRQADPGSPEAKRHPLPSWPDFTDLLSDSVDWPHRRMPFIFAGRMVESHLAALYTLERDGKTVGLLISSETSGGNDDDDD